jgi:hypothetical protein
MFASSSLRQRSARSRPHVEVVSPADLRDLVADLARRTADLYL